jgi:hypothetical protein
MHVRKTLPALCSPLLQSYAMNSNFANADLTSAVVNGVDFSGANLKGEGTAMFHSHVTQDLMSALKPVMCRMCLPSHKVCSFCIQVLPCMFKVSW